jgi:phage shock protein A
MGIFDRLKTVISSNMNDLISKAENPEKMLNQMIIEMNEQLIDSKKAVAMAIADEKRLEREVTENRPKRGMGEKSHARRQGRKGRPGQGSPGAQSRSTRATSASWAPSGRLRKSRWKNSRNPCGLQTKIEEASRKKNILIARAKRAEAQDKINNTMSSLQGSKSAFDTFDRMAKKIDELEARAEAQKELEDVSSGASLDKQFAALESSPAAADALLKT